MHEPREYEGYWWLPNEPDDKLAGKLTFSQDEIRLVLLGSFQEPRPGPITLDDVPRILGLGKGRDGKTRRITLENNSGLGQSMASPGFLTATYSPHVVLVGAHYDAGEDVLFDKLSIRYSDLDTWAYASGFEHEVHFDDTQTSLRKLDVSYTPPDRVEVDIDDKTSLSIEWRWSWSGLKRVMTESRIRQEAKLGVAFADKATVDRCLECVFQLRNFLSLGVGRPIRVLEVVGWHDLPPEQHPPSAWDVEILYQLIGTPPESTRELLPDEMLFNLSDARPRLAEIVQTWFDRREVLGPVFNRYFYLVHGEHIAREIQFESFVRALETYHRRTTDARELPDDQHEARMTSVLENVPPSHRDWLERKLHHSSELDLAARLHQIIGRCPTVCRRLIGTSGKAKDAFVRNVVTTRNYEIHLDPRNEPAAITDLRVVSIIFQLRALVEMTLLLDLGFPCEEVDAIFERIGRYRRIREIAEQVAAKP